MERSSELFEAFLKCPTKCWLQSRGEACEGNAYAQWVKGQNESYRAEGMRRLQATVPEGDRVVAPAMENLKGAKWRLAVDVVVQAPAPASSSSVSLPERTAGGIPGLGQPEDEKPALRPQPDPWMLALRLHAVERVAPEGRGKPTQFIPIRFIYRNKLTRDDRLLVAFDALVLSESLGRDTSLAKISHGDDHATLMVKTAGLLGEVRKLAVKMAEMLAGDSPPDIVLNRHCGECEFREQCRQKAFEKDDLSLLANMTAKERKKFRNKGIFTVTQLSYTFRPRRRPKRMRAKRDKYYHSLKALAIREKKVHIVGNPELKIEGTLVYLDVEGLPDRDFYYLVGIRVGNGESAVQHSFWADTVADEGRLWRQFLAILETAENPVVLHYGSFEKTFWRRMCQRHGEPPVGSKPAKAIDSAINLVSFAYAQIYFPTYSNQLKEIASWCGFSWSDPSLLGPNSIALRSDWEASGNPVAKQHLINYNAEDCKALEIVTRFACGVCRCESPGTNRPNSNVVVVDNLKPLKRFILINKDGAALPEFKEINKAAYWDYQRQRVYVRSSKIIKKASQGMHKRKAKCLPDQGTIYHAVPSACPRCGGVDLDVKDASSFLTLDVKLMRRGVKGLVRRVVWPQVYCKHCQQLVPPPGTPLFRIRKYGLRLRAYAISQLLELRISGAKVARSLNQIFHYGLTGSTISAFKSDFAKMYGDTVRKLTDRMVMGSLVQVDET